MASLRLSTSLGRFDSKKFNFSAQHPRQCSVIRLPCDSHVSKACVINSLSRSSRFENDVSDILGSSQDDNDPVASYNRDVVDSYVTNQSPNFEGEIRKRVGAKKSVKRHSSYNVRFRRIDSDLETKNLLVYDGQLDVNYSVIEADLSLEQCNAILRRLERQSDRNTLRFFDWMRSNGKLKQNLVAYNLVLRVLSRQAAWDDAEELVRELSSDSGSTLNYQVFNTVLYACSKAGHVNLGAKWFRMMLKYGVEPNVATFGMLMGLYQKGWNVEEAEFAFSVMRKFGIKCHSSYSAMITIYTRLRLYDNAEEIMGLMRKDELMLNSENWLVMLNAYCQQGKLDEAEAVFAAMQEAGLLPNLVAYNTMITGYGKISNMDAAQYLFQSLKNVGLEPDETTYRSMIEGWGRANNYKKAKWYYEELKRLGFRPNSSNLYTLINLQAKYGDEEGALATLNDMMTVGCQYSSILGTLLHAYKGAERINKVPQLLKGALYQHILVNQNSCSILVMDYVKHHLVDEAMNILREKRWKDPKFEDNLYHLLICSCKELGYLENAVMIYKCMPKSDDNPNLHIMCTMIDIYSAIGQFDEAESIYLKLKTSGTSLDMVAYSIAVRMYVKAGSLKDACTVLDVMEKQKDIMPDTYLFRDMFRIYQRCGMVNKLADLYYRLLKSEITWDQELYNCVINCCARALPVDELSQLFDEMLQCGFTPNTITVNVMLDIYGKSRLFTKARSLFQMARKKGLDDIISYNTLVAAYGKNKDLKNMLSVVKIMQFNGLSVSLEAYNCMLDAYGKEGQMENFRNVLQRMKASGYSSDHYTYNIMINIYGERKWIDEIADVLMELKECGLEPDLCSYNTLIKAYGIAGMVEDAVGLIKEMREKGIEPDRVTYVNLISALQKNDKFLEAVRWSLWMKQISI